jgi:hypothetical protein
MSYKYLIFYTDTIYKDFILKYSAQFENIKTCFGIDLTEIGKTEFSYLIITSTRNFLDFHKLLARDHEKSMNLENGFLFTRSDANEFAACKMPHTYTYKYPNITTPLQGTNVQELLATEHFAYFIADHTYARGNYEILYRVVYDNYKTTFYTFFFDLQHLRDASVKTRGTEFYMEKGKATLMQKYPFVIYCDATHLEDIQSLRNSVCPVNQTVYVVKNITDYEIYKTTQDIVTHNRSLLDRYDDVRITPSYTATMIFKIVALRLTHAMDPYKTPYFAWIDFGCSHVCRDVAVSVPAIAENPKPRATFLYIHYRSHDELAPMDKYMKYGHPCGIAGGFFTVERDYVMRFYAACMSIYHEMLVRGVGHNDEAVFTYCYDRYPELFTLNYGDYYSLFTNYLYVTQDFDTIKKYFIGSCLSKNRKDLAATATLNVLDSIANKKIDIDHDNIKWLKLVSNA